MLPTSNHMKAPLNSMYFDCYWWTAVELKHVRWSKTKKKPLKNTHSSAENYTIHYVSPCWSVWPERRDRWHSKAFSSVELHGDISTLWREGRKKKASSFTRVIGQKCKLSKFTTIFETPPSQHFLQRFVDFLCNLVCWKVLKLFELKFINVVRYSLFDF